MLLIHLLMLAKLTWIATLDQGRPHGQLLAESLDLLCQLCIFHDVVSALRFGLNCASGWYGKSQLGGEVEEVAVDVLETITAARHHRTKYLVVVGIVFVVSAPAVDVVKSLDHRTYVSAVQPPPYRSGEYHAIVVFDEVCQDGFEFVVVTFSSALIIDLVHVNNSALRPLLFEFCCYNFAHSICVADVGFF